MSAASSPKAKRGGAVSPTEDDLIPLLLAAHPTLIPNYKAMAAMDKQGRSFSALEHKFRKWRARAKEIMEDNKGEEDSNKEGKAKIGKAEGPKVVKGVGAKRVREDSKGSDNESVGYEEEPCMNPKSVRVQKGTAQKVVQSPIAKKPKIEKKGTARVVKKPWGMRGGGPQDNTPLVHIKGKVEHKPMTPSVQTKNLKAKAPVVNDPEEEYSNDDGEAGDDGVAVDAHEMQFGIEDH